MERPKSKDKAINEYIDHLENKLSELSNNSSYSSYVSMKMIVDSINGQIQKLKIDITSSEGEQQFKTISKYASLLSDYSDQLEAFRLKLNPQEVESANKKSKELIVKEGGVEEYLKSKK